MFALGLWLGEEVDPRRRLPFSSSSLPILLRCVNVNNAEGHRNKNMLGNVKKERKNGVRLKKYFCPPSIGFVGYERSGTPRSVVKVKELCRLDEFLPRLTTHANPRQVPSFANLLSAIWETRKIKQTEEKKKEPPAILHTMPRIELLFRVCKTMRDIFRTVPPFDSHGETDARYGTTTTTTTTTHKKQGRRNYRTIRVHYCHDFGGCHTGMRGCYTRPIADKVHT